MELCEWSNCGYGCSGRREVSYSHREPNESAVSEEKVSFYTDLQKEVDACEGSPIAIGDLNSQVDGCYESLPRPLRK